MQISRIGEQTIFIEIGYQIVIGRVAAYPIQPDSIDPLEDILALAMLGSAAVLLEKLNNFLEARDNTRLLVRASSLLFRLGIKSQLREDFVVAQIMHMRPLPYVVRTRPRLPPSAFPKHLEM